MEQRRLSEKLWNLFCFFSFLISIFFAANQTGWADVGPAISNQTQKESAPVARAVTQVTAARSARLVCDESKEEKEEKEEDEITYTAWFDDVREGLKNEVFEIHPRFRSDYVLDSNIFL